MFYIKQAYQYKLMFVERCLSALGSLWLLVQVIDYTKITTLDIGAATFFSCAICFGICYFLFDGICKTGFLKKEITISADSQNTKIKIKFGDIFKEKGVIAIAVNEFFDWNVDERLVSSKNLHGMMLQKIWSGNTANWYQSVANDLREAQITGESYPRDAGNSIKYQIGTTAYCSLGEMRFLCVVLTQTDEHFKASANLADLETAIDGLLTKAYNTCSNQPLSIPLMGSGLSGVDDNNYQLVIRIISLIRKRSKQKRITSEINLVLHESNASTINLQCLKKMWS